MFQEIQGWLVTGIVVGALIAFAFLVFLITRYRKFKTNQFVIHLRNGKVKHAGLGGSLWLLPLIDEFVIIPTTTIQTMLEASEKVVSQEYQDIAIVGMLYWKVIDPEKAFSAVSWFPHDNNYVEKILKTAAEAIIRTTCANMPIEKIIRERREIINIVSKDLHDLTSDWGIVIESLEIREVNVLNEGLKGNMEALKQAEELQKARLARAEAERNSRLKELEVQNEVGAQEQMVQKEIEMQRKDKEIAVAEKERDRMKIAADGERQKKLIEVDADAQQIKKKLIAQAEGEAESIKQQMLAQAEGFQKQIEAMSSADERFLAVQLTNILPEIFKELNPDKMIIVGNGNDAFSSISKAIIPFLEVLPDYQEKIKKFVGEDGSKAKELLAKIKKPQP